jgi:lysozyme
MNPSKACLDLIKSFEGFRAHAYPDPGTGGAPWTCGYGHTGHDVTPATLCTVDVAAAWLATDVECAAFTVRAAVKVPLTQGQFDALCSLIYNIGHGEAGHRDGIVVLANGNPSTLLRKLNAADYAGAADQFPLWNRAGGHVMPGLVSRRAAERSLFLS